MENMFVNTRWARAARAVAARLESSDSVRLYPSSDRGHHVVFLMFNYLNKYCGRYTFITSDSRDYITVVKEG